jgi:hypothetical protein
MQTQCDSNSAASTLLFPPNVELSNHTFQESHAEWLDVGPLHGEAECLPQAIANCQDLGKGVRWALAIEAAAALSIYAIWSLCHSLF